MYKNLQLPLAVIGVLGLLTVSINFAFGWGKSLLAADSDPHVKLPGIPVELKRAWGVDEISFEKEEVPNLGYVIWARAKTKDMVSPCYLGAYYLMPKKVVGKLESGGLSVFSTLRTAIRSENYLSPGAKEFNNAFLVFEPNKKACPGGIFAQKRENELRKVLWQAIKTSNII